MILTNYAMQLCAIKTSNTKQRGALEKNRYEKWPETEDINIELSGRYGFKVCNEVLKNMEELNEIDVEWISDRKREKRNNHRYKLHKDLVSVIYKKIQTNSSGMNEHVGKMVVGYTKAVMIASSIERTIFYAHLCFQNQKRYDWALVHFEEEDRLGVMTEKYYACKLLGLISTDGKSCEGVIQRSVQPILWEKVETKLLQKFTLGTDIDVSYVTVPVEAIVHPLCVIPDIGGDSNEYVVILPKKNWSRLFGNKIGV
jgi:hypothetical protein